jgi:hypothetical protein
MGQLQMKPQQDLGEQITFNRFFLDFHKAILKYFSKYVKHACLKKGKTKKNASLTCNMYH